MCPLFFRYLHRDIKPANFAMGKEHRVRRTVIMLGEFSHW